MTAPEWLPDWAADITLGTIIAWALVGAGVWIGIRKLGKILQPLIETVQAIKDFLTDWNGAEAVRDVSGAIIRDAEPGMLARVKSLETAMVQVRHQVKNDHKTNLRDDVDQVIDKVAEMKEIVDEHIRIAKQSDADQQEIKTKVERLDSLWGEKHNMRATPPGGLPHSRGGNHD